MTEKDMESIRRWLSGIVNSIRLMVRRGKTGVVNDENPVQTIAVSIFKNENRTGVERFQEFGSSSVPPEGGEAIVVFLGGDGSHPVIVATNDRRYRPQGQKPGDNAMHTDKPDHGVFLTADGREALVIGKKIIIQADDEVIIDAPKTRVLGDLEVTGDIISHGDVTDVSGGGGLSMRRMRDIYNPHIHRENDNGGPTAPPMEKM